MEYKDDKSSNRGDGFVSELFTGLNEYAEICQYKILSFQKTPTGQEPKQGSTWAPKKEKN